MEEKVMIDVNELREELGFAKDCYKCNRNVRACEMDSYFSRMEFCVSFDDAVETILERHRLDEASNK